jgi:hypothetical protein
MAYDDDYEPQVSGHTTENGFAFTVEVRPPSEEAICDALARRMAADYGLSKDLNALVADRVAELIREAVDDAAKAAIQQLLDEPRQRTDSFGNPEGEPMSFRKMLTAEVVSWQDETVSRHDGKPKKADSYNRSDVVTRKEYLVRQVGAEEFEKLAKAEVAKVKQEAKARVERTIQGAVASAISSLAKVPS